MSDNELEALAKALWYMFAVGPEANKWDERTRGTWMKKALRIEEMRVRNLG